MTVVGVYVAFSKVILESVPVFVLAALRFGLAALMMLPWTFPKGGRALLRGQMSTLFLLSFFGNFLFSICMLSGVARTSAAAAGLILSTLPAVVALFSVVLLRERMDLAGGLAIVLAVIGIGFLTVHETGIAEDFGRVAGNLLMVGAIACEAIFVVVGKRLTTAHLGPFQISAWMNLVGFVLMLPLGLAQARSFAFANVSPEVWGLVVLYAFAASVISPWLWLSGLKTVPANRAGVFTIALPIASAAIGVLFLNERLGIAHLVAFVCAFLGIILVTRAGFFKPAPRAPLDRVHRS
jgi:drug/metabolite transporter (DMT)-like permease